MLSAVASTAYMPQPLAGRATQSAKASPVMAQGWETKAASAGPAYHPILNRAPNSKTRNMRRLISLK